MICWNEPCTEPVTNVVLVPTYGMDAMPEMPSHMPEFTCEGHAPELMHELLNVGYERQDLITATFDTRAGTPVSVTGD